MNYKSALEMVIEQLTHDVKRAGETVEGFAKKLIGNSKPLWHLNNCDGAFRFAAVANVYGEMLEALSKEGTKATLFTAQAYAQDQALNNCKRGSQSTSVTSNLCRDMEGAAWAELESFLRGACAIVDAPEAEAIKAATLERQNAEEAAARAERDARRAQTRSSSVKRRR